MSHDISVFKLIYGGELAEPELYHLPSDLEQRDNIFRHHRDIAEKFHSQYYKLLEELGAAEARLKLRRKFP